MRNKVLTMFTAFVAVISFTLLPSCSVDELTTAVEDAVTDVSDAIDSGEIDLTQFEDVVGLLGSDDGGETISDAGTGTGLSIAETITVVDVSDTTVAKPSGLAKALHAASDLAATTDYGVALANQQIYVEDRANEAFEMATMILCYMGELRHSEMVNQGAYLALVDTNKCETSRDSKDNAGSDLEESQSGSSASGEATSVNYERWVVVSHRADEASPQNVRFWVEGDQGEQSGTIEARLIIWEGKSDANPLGLFKLNFQEVAGTTVTMKGYLEAAKAETSDEVQLRFIMDMTMTECFGEMNMVQAGTLVRDTDADGAFTGTGKGRAHSTTDYGDVADFSTCGGPGDGPQKAGSGTAGARNEGEDGGGGGPGPVDVKFTMAFDEDYFLRKGELTPLNIDTTTMIGTAGTTTSGEVCLDRVNVDESAWRYGLFADENATTPGEALHVNSGFPITWDDADGEEQHGHVGYWGLWDPTGELANNYIVQEEVWGDATPASYNIFKGGGKLTKHTKETMTLAQLENVDLISGMEIPNPDFVSTDPPSETNQPAFWKQSILQWRGADGMMIVGEIDEDNWQPIYYGDGTATDDDEDENTEETAYAPRVDDWHLWFWSEALGGSGYVVLQEEDTDNPGTQIAVTLADTSEAIFHMSSVVAPGDTTVPASLACFQDCPTGALVDTASPYDPNSTWDTMWNADGTVLTTHFEVVNNGYWDYETNAYIEGSAIADLTAGTNYAAYTFNTTTYKLMDGATTPASIERTSAAEGDLSWGVWTGAMIDVDDISTALTCDWDATAICSWKVNNADTYYTWETGTDEWSKYTGLKNSQDEFVQFDPPFKVEYTHTYDDASTGTFILEYGGYGDLWGIPGICVDQDTGAEVDCWDETVEFMRYVPGFTIPDDSVLTTTRQDTGAEATYYSLALEKEQRLVEAADGSCTTAGLTIDETLTLPTIALWLDPTTGPMPVVAAAPAVIDGVVQE